jgi:hypothetical protein
MSNTEATSTQENFAIDIDFETYEVPAPKAETLRNDLAILKKITWLHDLFAWVKEKGDDYQNSEQNELIEATFAKRLKWEDNHVLSSLELILEASDLEIIISRKKFAILQQLPKGEEILVSYYNPLEKENFETLQGFLQNELKLFSKAKAERNKLIQEKLAQKKLSQETST